MGCRITFKNSLVDNCICYKFWSDHISSDLSNSSTIISRNHIEICLSTGSHPVLNTVRDVSHLKLGSFKWDAKGVSTNPGSTETTLTPLDTNSLLIAAV